MLDLTFGEQVKIILSRKGMTIKELAETIEERTGKKMSRQNLTQRLGRDNFQEQDMRMIAEILGCPFSLSILGDDDSQEKSVRYRKEEKKMSDVREEEAFTDVKPHVEEKSFADEKPHVDEKPLADVKSPAAERDITIGELVEIHEELDALIQEETGELPPLETPVEELLEEVAALEAEEKEQERSSGISKEEEQEEERKARGWMSYLQRRKKKPEQNAAAEEPKEQEADESYEDNGDDILADEAQEQIFEGNEDEDGYVDYDVEEGPDEMYAEPEEDYDDEDRVNGEVNPYTGREYETNSVRMHPNRIGYVQVYDREDHAWTDMTEWAFLGYQERKKALLGKDYEPPIYLD